MAGWPGYERAILDGRFSPFYCLICRKPVVDFTVEKDLCRLQYHCCVRCHGDEEEFNVSYSALQAYPGLPIGVFQKLKMEREELNK